MADNQEGSGYDTSGSARGSRARSPDRSVYSVSRSRSRSRSRSTRYSADRDYYDRRSRTRRRSSSRDRRHRRGRYNSPYYRRRSYSRSRSRSRRRSRTPHRSFDRDAQLKQEIVTEVVRALKNTSNPPNIGAGSISPPGSPTEGQDVESTHEIIPPATTSSSHLKNLVDHYEKQTSSDDDPSDPPILEGLNAILKHWWWKMPAKDEIKKLLEQCARPENCEAVKKVYINDEIFKKIGQKGRDDDQNLRIINHSLTRGAQPLVSAWNEIIKAESVVKDSHAAQGVTSDEDAFLSLPDGEVLNLTKVRQQLALSLQVLGLTNTQMVVQRRSAMKSSLNKQYQELCDPRRPFTHLMFGENLRSQMDEITRMSKLGSDIVTPKHKSPASQRYWRNRGGRGRGFLPGRGHYQQQQKQQNRSASTSRQWKDNQNDQSRFYNRNKTHHSRRGRRY